MKRYILTFMIALNLLSTNIYGVETFMKQYNVHNDTHHYFEHEHIHKHNGSSHQHNHSHAQAAAFSDFYVNPQYVNVFKKTSLKLSFLEASMWIPEPNLETLFRPPIV